MSIDFAATALSTIVDELDNGVIIDEFDYQFAVESFAVCADRARRSIKALKYLRDGLAEEKAAIEQRIENAKDALERLQQLVAKSMNDNPSLDWAGAGFRFQVNGGKNPVSFVKPLDVVGRVVDDASLYPQEWLEAKTVYTLKPGFEDAVRRGEVVCNGATVEERGMHLRLK